MADETSPPGFRERLTKQGEDVVGKLAQDLLENPLVMGAVSRAFDARERALQAQEAAMSVLNLPSAADIERLTRRLRSVSQRMEGIEEAVDRLESRLEAASAGSAAHGVEERLAAIDERLTRLVAEFGQLTAALDAGPAPVHREQARLEVDERPGPAPPRLARDQAS